MFPNNVPQQCSATIFRNNFPERHFSAINITECSTPGRKQHEKTRGGFSLTSGPNAKTVDSLKRKV